MTNRAPDRVWIDHNNPDNQYDCDEVHITPNMVEYIRKDAACVEVKKGYSVMSSKTERYYQKTVPLSEALEIRTVDDVRREALEGWESIVVAKRVAYRAGYYQAECRLPEPEDVTAAVEKLKQDVRREAYAEGYRDGFKKSGWSEMERQDVERYKIDTPAPSTEELAKEAEDHGCKIVPDILRSTGSLLEDAAIHAMNNPQSTPSPKPHSDDPVAADLIDQLQADLQHHIEANEEWADNCEKKDIIIEQLQRERDEARDRLAEVERIAVGVVSAETAYQEGFHAGIEAAAEELTLLSMAAVEDLPFVIDSIRNIALSPSDNKQE